MGIELDAEMQEIMKQYFVDFGEGVTSETIRKKGLDAKTVEILCDYSAFSSDADLTNLFKSTPLLSPWKHSVPDAGSVKDRVYFLYAFLHDKRRADKIPALEIFLKALRDTKGGDILVVETKKCANCGGSFTPQTAPGSAISCPTCGSRNFV